VKYEGLNEPDGNHFGSIWQIADIKMLAEIDDEYLSEEELRKVRELCLDHEDDIEESIGASLIENYIHQIVQDRD